MDNRCDLSIVIPIYNVEQFLEPCLQSVVDQGLSDVEVLMIDDGSTDGSAEIAQRFASEHDCFHYYRKKNGGLGSARNYGIQKAKGSYITFLDSDDVIPDGAYSKMLRLAFDNNSDIVTGNVERFTSKKQWPSSLHKNVYAIEKSSTTILQTPALLFDTIACNKLFRAGFWREVGVSFPEGVLYEDIPVTIPLFCKAQVVSMLRDTVYLWRAREGASQSITQSRADFKNMADRIAALRGVDNFIAQHVNNEEIKRIKQWKWLDLDLPIYLNACPLADEHYFNYLADYAIDCYQSADDGLKDRLSVPKRMKYEAICLRNRELLLQVIDYEKQEYKYDKVIRQARNGGVGYYLAAPRRFKTTFSPETFYMNRNLEFFPPICVVKAAVWEGPEFQVEGFCAFPKVPCHSAQKRKLEAWLVNEASGEKVQVPIRGTKAQGVRGRNGVVFGRDVAGRRRFSYFNYRGSGYALSIDFSSHEIQAIAHGSLYIEITMQQNGLVNTFMLSGKTKSTKTQKQVFLDYGRAVVRFDQTGILRLNFDADSSYLSSLDCEPKKDVRFTISRFSGEASPVALVNANSNSILECLSSGDGWILPYYALCSADEGVYEFRCGEDPVYTREGFDGKSYHVGEFCHLFAARKDGSMVFIKQRFAPYGRLQNGGSLEIQCPSTLLRSSESWGLYAVTKGKQIGIAFTAESMWEADGQTFLVFNLRTPSGADNLTEGTWHLVLANTNNLLHPNACILEVLADPTLSGDVSISSDHSHRVAATSSGDLVIKSKMKWGSLESTRPRRRMIEEYLYPLMRLLPIDSKKIVFEGLWGRKYYCNPRALSEYIAENYPGYKCVWSLNDERHKVGNGAIPVRRRSLRYFFHMATAKYLVNNVNFHGSFKKKHGQVYVQTMHGMPLKTLGLDAPGEFKTEKAVEDFLEKCKTWDYVVVQNREVERIVESAYHFHGPFLETGYPRNDLLFDDTFDEEALRVQLGLPKGKKIILYAPTWRTEGIFDFHFSIDNVRQALSDDYVMLLRVHPLASKGLSLDIIDNEFIFNVTNYPTTEDLFRIADVAITDYSSLMFDFSITEKPMLFYAYDLDSYRDRLRGLYFDYEEIIPGPIVKTEEELIVQLKDYNHLRERCSAQIDCFRERFCCFENGGASRAICKQLLGK